MHQVAPDVHHLSQTPRFGINVYVVGDVLVDAGVSWRAKGLVDALRGTRLSAHALTHAHLDHAGGSRAVVQAFDVPVWAGEHDAADVESGAPEPPAHAPGPRAVGRRIGAFPGTPVARRLREGDELTAGFVVLDTPGHSNGHVAFWRASDRVLICGDVVFGMNVFTTAPGMHEPLRIATTDPERNRASIRRIAELEPTLVLPGHGPPVRDAAAPLRALADGLA